MKMQLSPPDEYFNHQWALPHAFVGSSDPSWRERYWLSFQDIQNKDVVVTCGLGKYPNHDTMEAFVSVATPDQQYNVRSARQLSPDTHLMNAGPFRIEVVEPLKTLRLILDENESGMAMDMIWHGSFEAGLESRHFQVSRTRVVHDLVRYVQHGRLEGTVQIPGRMWTATRDTWYGERDHSWGLRTLPREPGAPPTPPPSWRFLLFCPIQFEDFGLHFYLWEDARGRLDHLSAGLSYPWGANMEEDEDPIIAVEHDLDVQADAPTPTVLGGKLTLRFLNGKTWDLAITAHPVRAYLRGGGYNLDHGQWHGETWLDHNVWDLHDAERGFFYAVGSADHLIEARLGDRIGYGVAEYSVLPGYHRYPELLARRRR